MPSSEDPHLSLLSRMVSELMASRPRVPESLRLIAVGGAMTSPSLLAQAKALGLPVYEAYGLSECCLVLARNMPCNARHGTVGKVLDGVDLRIDDGEITISGPTVMEGYIGQPPVTGKWRTRDLGRIEDGYLIFEGHKDWLIVTPQGRNINAEWVKACLCATTRETHCKTPMQSRSTLTRRFSARDETDQQHGQKSGNTKATPKPTTESPLPIPVIESVRWY